MIQPAAAPEAKRATASAVSDCASAAERHQDGGERAHDGDGAVFAEAVADRADDELDRAVGDRIGGDHDRGGADGGAEVGGDLRQQRIGDPHLRLAGKARDREQDDRAGRDFLRWDGRSRSISRRIRD